MTPSWLILVLALFLPIPVGADHSMRRRPWATYGLIAINLAVYLATQPDRTTSGSSLFARWGVAPAQPHALALITSQFIHVSLWHLLFNMLFLWVFAPLVEDALGSFTFLVLYLGGGVAADLLNTAISVLIAAHDSNLNGIVLQPLVGASGSISAVLAPYAVRYHRAKLYLIWPIAYLIRSPYGELEMPAVVAVALWVLQNLAGGIRGIILPGSGDIAYWAHIGGFAFGFVAAAMTGLFREGWQEYLLADARAAAKRGTVGYDQAVDKYRAFLQIEPRNGDVRVELASILSNLAKIRSSKLLAERAAEEIGAAINDFQASGNVVGAVGACAAAKRLSIPLRLASRERLRLAGAAQDLREDAVAISLLQTLLGEAPNSPEDEIARLKLGQLLLATDPPAAAEVLSELIAKYPRSQWVGRARELLAQAQAH